MDLLIAARFVGIAGAVYLAWRAIVAALRIRWARHAYPDAASIEPGNAFEGELAWRDRCRGALVGGAIGDALNLPAESLPRWLARLRYASGPKMRRGAIRFLRRAGDVSDDTQLTICVARSIDPNGRYCHQRFLSELGRWSYYRVGAGRASSRAAARARRGERDTGQPSEGNGVAIRVAPFALSVDSEAALRAVVGENGRATHDGEVAVSGAVFVALLIRACLRQPVGFLDDDAGLRRAIEALAEASELPPVVDVFSAPPVAPSGHVVECIPAVVSVLLAHGTDVEAAMMSVFRGGGDTDSVGAIVGACIGAQIGFEALPAAWRSVVQHRDTLVWLADRLSTPRTDPERRAEIVSVTGDITTRSVDAMVNAWNRNAIPAWLLLPSGVASAIRSGGGRSAIMAVSRSSPLPLGAAIETGAGTLPATWVIHADAIDLAWRASSDSICAATRNALQLARWLGARTVALPLLGAGSGGAPAEAAAAIIADVVETFRGDFDRIEVVTLESSPREATESPGREGASGEDGRQ